MIRRQGQMWNSWTTWYCMPTTPGPGPPPGHPSSLPTTSNILDGRALWNMAHVDTLALHLQALSALRHLPSSWPWPRAGLGVGFPPLGQTQRRGRYRPWKGAQGPKGIPGSWVPGVLSRWEVTGARLVCPFGREGRACLEKSKSGRSKVCDPG